MSAAQLAPGGGLAELASRHPVGAPPESDAPARAAAHRLPRRRAREPARSAPAARPAIDGQMLRRASRRRAEIEGVPACRGVADLPVAPDAAFVSIPADATIEAVGDLAAMGAGGAVCYASGFAELGETGTATQRRPGRGRRRSRARRTELLRHHQLRQPWQPLADAISRAHARRRGAAVVGQSGNLCINLSMNQREVPFSYIISAGNQAVLGFEDYIDVLVDDPKVTAIGLFLEGIRDVPAFSAACRKALRAGHAPRGAAASASRRSVRRWRRATRARWPARTSSTTRCFERFGILTTHTVPQFLELLKALLGRRGCRRGGV